MRRSGKEMPPFQQSIHQVADFIRGTRWVLRVVAAYCLVMGFSIVFAGTPRFSAEAYDYFRHVPGSPDSWGYLLIGCGMVMLMGMSMYHDRITAVGVGLAGLWSAILCGSFLASAIDHPEANLTAIIVYGKDAVCYIVFAIILFHYGKYRKEPDEPPFTHHSSASNEDGG